jgi:membrane-bound lytic murein transglycosylase D
VEVAVERQGDTAVVSSLADRGDSATVAPSDVAGEALQLFGTTKLEPPADSAAPEEEVTWDIDVRSFETHARVEYFVNRYAKVARERFSQWLQRGGRYEKMMRTKLREGGLPEDLAYLALIESGYDVHAYSRAAAVGIWQFMASTARGVGLRVDWWVDERRDPVRATDGAVRFLSALNDQFGSLYLAAAAYNGGPGRISRGLTRYADDLEGHTGDSIFFALAEKDYLRAETKDYVPRLIAAALIAKDPKRYGLEVEYDDEIAYDTVRVGPATPLAAIGKAAGTSTDVIRDLNPGILRGMTPPRDSFTIRIPVGTAEGFHAALAALPREEKVAFTRNTARKGETMTALARRAGVSVKQLSWYNPRLSATRSGPVPAGEVVIFPTRAVASAARDVPDPSIERYGSSSTTTHVVKRGESLGLIARRYRTTVNSIMQLNGLRKSVIYPGQVLVVRGSPARRAPAPATNTVRAATASSPSSTAVRIHVVKRGESLTSIARKYDTTVKALKELNGLRGDFLREGQRIKVRG